MRKLRTALLACIVGTANWALAADMIVPQRAVAGDKISIETSGSGDATALLVAPSHLVSKSIVLGRTFELAGDDLADAGEYTLILTSGAGEIAKKFFVSPGPPAHLSFVTHPSRAPVAQKSGITGAVYAFDSYDNLISQSLVVDFKLSGAQAGTIDRQASSRSGVASVSLDSPAKEGLLRFEAATGGVRTTRVVRVVADEPCTLQIHAEPLNSGRIRVQTAPVKDCSGNLVPDGTVVTFTGWDKQGRTTVDVSVKKGIAQVDLPASGEVRISAASGVALGKEIRLRAAP
ncbi:MAG TPA: hypothetical protein VFU50_09610 [Terriglobales bacterium]|nr:hypothetical protein [Terriglobales bacterium]